MLLYLDHAYEEHPARGRMHSMGNLYAAVREGALQRIRPKVMTMCAILFGLLPILWATATRTVADVMERIVPPMVGGVVTSATLELLLYPVVFVLWKGRGPKRDEPGAMGDLPVFGGREDRVPALHARAWRGAL